MSRALCDTVPHVAVAHGGHGDHGPPEGVRDRLEERLLGAGLGEIHDAREEDHSCNTQRKEAREGRCVPVSRRSTPTTSSQTLAHTLVHTLDKLEAVLPLSFTNQVRNFSHPTKKKSRNSFTISSARRDEEFF